MIQILGLREYTTREGRVSIKHAFFNNNWRADSVASLFANIDNHIAQIPEDERWNIFFTVHNCEGKEARDFKYGELIPVDVDKIDLNKIPETIACVLKALDLQYNRTGILCSGNGLQFFIKTSKYVESFFSEKKEYYKLLCIKVNDELSKAGLPGNCDTSVFDMRRIMRMPSTWNRKKGKDDKLAYLIQPHIDSQDFSFSRSIGIDEVGVKDHISLKALKSFPKPDTKSIQEECEFLKYCMTDQATVSEPEWYAMLSIVGHLENGTELIHEYSKQHPGYTYEATKVKGEQAIVVSGPRTCRNINNIWGKCKGCKHFGKLTSPILIQGEDFIRTETTGFYDVTLTSNGATRRVPNYNDMLKAFKRKHTYFTNDTTGNVYVHTGVYWRELPHTRIMEFPEQVMEPAPTASMRDEFLKKVKVNNLRSDTEANQSTEGVINLLNGVLNLNTGELLPHDKKYFFKGVLPYEYDARATAPRFMQFLRDITLNKAELMQVLLEFLGYAICHTHNCKYAKALIMHGTGANGKSTFMEVIKALIGKDLYSTVSLANISTPRSAISLSGKLVNIGEETSVHSLANHENFKTIVTGGEIEMHRYYQNPHSERVTTKLMFACNKLPYTNDDTDGLFRRLLIVPFKAKFTGSNDNIDLKDELLKELPGILNIVIDSYKNLVARGRFNEGSVLKNELQQYKNDNDMIYNWFIESCDVTGNENDRVLKTDLFDSFLSYCEASNIPKHQWAYSKLAFFKHVTHLLVDKPSVVETRLRQGTSTNRVYVYTGLKLINEREGIFSV